MYFVQVRYYEQVYNVYTGKCCADAMKLENV